MVWVLVLLGFWFGGGVWCLFGCLFVVGFFVFFILIGFFFGFFFSFKYVKSVLGDILFHNFSAKTLEGWQLSLLK